MIKFSKIDEVVEQKYEAKDTLRNQINDLIEETISIKITNGESIDKDINIDGKEELVEKIKGLIDNNRLNERISALEYVKKNVYQNFDMKWLTEQIDNLKSFEK